MPPDPDMFLDQVAHSPCPDPEEHRAALLPALPFAVNANYLPVVELGRQLGQLLALNVGLAEHLPRFIWRDQPAPLPMCRELDEMRTHLEEIEEAAARARMTCLFLWEIASQARED